MAITDIISNQQPKSTEFDCLHYAPLPGKKRCRHFLKNGACDRPDELMCIEWLKRNNSPKKAESHGDFRLEVQTMPKPEPRPERPAPEPSPVAQFPPSPHSPPPTLTGLTLEDIESFKALKVEVCLKSESFGEMWLVPEYTGKDRQELTAEHAATICRLLQAFPGSKVTAFEKTSTQKENSK